MQYLALLCETSWCRASGTVGACQAGGAMAWTRQATHGGQEGAVALRADAATTPNGDAIAERRPVDAGRGGRLERASADVLSSAEVMRDCVRRSRHAKPGAMSCCWKGQREWRGGNSKYTRNIRCVHGADAVMPGSYTSDELEADLGDVSDGTLVPRSDDW